MASVSIRKDLSLRQAGQGSDKAVSINWLGVVWEAWRSDTEVRSEVVLNVSVSESLELKVVERVECLGVVWNEKWQVVTIMVALNVPHNVVLHALNGILQHLVLLNFLFLDLHVSLRLYLLAWYVYLVGLGHVLIEFLLEEIVWFGLWHRFSCQKFLCRFL